MDERYTQYRHRPRHSRTSSEGNLQAANQSQEEVDGHGHVLPRHIVSQLNVQFVPRTDRLSSVLPLSVLSACTH
jgi:hypothetical protein